MGSARFDPARTNQSAIEAFEPLVVKTTSPLARLPARGEIHEEMSQLETG